MRITCVLSMAGFPKARPRVIGNRSHMPPLYVKRKRLCADLVRASGPMKQLTGALCLTVRFRFRRHGRGDLDNLVGGLMDALNGLCYADDSQVEQIAANIERNCKVDEIHFSLSPIVRGKAKGDSNAN